jgi:carbamoyltransferase
MNLKIKFRESFRPFAPMVLQEKAQEWFQMRQGQESPYMLLVAPVLEKHRMPLDEQQRETMHTDPDLRHRVNIARSTIPAVTHVDYSARVQTVDRRRNPRLHGLLSAFHGRTGCPVLVNTSFNIRGEPIVCSPQDAYRCFLGTHMDALVLGNLLLLKEEQHNVKEIDTESYQAAFSLD